MQSPAITLRAGLVALLAVTLTIGVAGPTAANKGGKNSPPPTPYVVTFGDGMDLQSDGGGPYSVAKGEIQAGLYEHQALYVKLVGNRTFTLRVDDTSIGRTSFECEHGSVLNVRTADSGINQLNCYNAAGNDGLLFGNPGQLATQAIAVGAVAADFAGGRVENIHSVHFHAQPSIRFMKYGNVRLAEDDEKVAFAGALQLAGHVKIGIHAGLKNRDAAELAEFRRVRRVIERTGDEHVESRISGFTGSGGVLLAGLRWAVEQGFDVINMREINAFALPGGFLYVNSGLLLAAAERPVRTAIVVVGFEPLDVPTYDGRTEPHRELVFPPLLQADYEPAQSFARGQLAGGKQSIVAPAAPEFQATGEYRWNRVFYAGNPGQPQLPDFPDVSGMNLECKHSLR